MKPSRKSFLSELHHILTTRQRKTIDDLPYPRAAVLVPFFQKGEACHLLFTKRSDQVKHHKGQISFPGGVFDREDESLAQTALRESFEEVGLRPSDVHLIGSLDDIITTTKFIVTPFVGLFPYPYPFRVSEVEIAELIEVPLSCLLKRDALGQTVVREQDHERIVDAYRYGRHTIWGATARILKQLLELIPKPR